MTSDILEQYIKEIEQNENVQKMDSFIQHGRVTTLEHAENVARLGAKIDNNLRLKCDEKVLIRGAMLHDFFLYDWHIDDKERPLHGFYHPKLAMQNAVKYFDINDKEKNVILSHMWPLTIRSIPRCREAWVVCLADKISSTKETIQGFIYRKSNDKRS